LPELPEVETIKNDLLRENVVGVRIEAAEVLAQPLVEGGAAEEFAGRLSGETVADARRRGKNLILDLGDDGSAAVFQLKIGGQLLLVPPVEEPATALMLRLRLADGRSLFLRDETGYTRARLYGRGELREWSAGLGPEPLSEEFTAEYLRAKIGGRRAQIKPLLLDQKVVAGIGNIYVDESLFDARIHPRRKANSLLDGEWEALHAAISENLGAGIRDRGTTFSLYRDLLGRKGGHQENLRVFLRAGKPCPAGCGGKVVKEQVGGRATFVCPGCQLESGPKGGEALLFG